MIEEGKKGEVKVPEYPYLGVYVSGAVVLFTGEDTGVVVRVSRDFNVLSDHSIGVVGVNWCEHLCKPYKGDIILRNVL